MKILIASHYFASHKSGIELVVDKLYRELRLMGQQLTWIASDATPPPADIGKSCAVPLRTSNFIEARLGIPVPIPTLSALRKIRAEVKHADVLVIHDCLYLSNIAAFVFARVKEIPTIIVQHTVPNERGLFNVLMKLATAVITEPMLSRADEIVFISESTKRFYRSTRFRNPPQVIFNGVDPEVFRPLPETETKSNLRSGLGLPPDRRLVLFVGRFVAKKGLPILRRMVAMRPEYTWVFAGWGPLDPGDWGSNSVRVFSAPGQTSLAKLYQASDVLVLPSTREGFPLVIQEALACGLPVVCGAGTAMADPALVPFVRAVCPCPQNEKQTASSFLSAIESLFATVANQEADSESRRAFVLKRYSWRRAAERYLDIASRLVAKCAPMKAEEVDAGAGLLLP